MTKIKICQKCPKKWSIHVANKRPTGCTFEYLKSCWHKIYLNFCFEFCVICREPLFFAFNLTAIDKDRWPPKQIKQEYILVGCILPTCWLYSVVSHVSPGGLPNPLLDADPPLDAEPPWMQTPLEAEPPGHVTCDACWEANPPVGRMTDACENITLPQTSFAGSKYIGSVRTFLSFFWDVRPVKWSQKSVCYIWIRLIASWFERERKYTC